MKTLELTTGYDMVAKCSAFQFKIEENKAVKVSVTKAEAIIRGLLVYTMPVLSAFDWNAGTHTMFFIAPVIFYLGFTAFNMFCPIKAWFSNYSE